MIGFAPDLFTPGVTSKIELQSALPALDNNITIQGPGECNLTVEPAPDASYPLLPGHPWSRLVG